MNKAIFSFAFLWMVYTAGVGIYFYNKWVDISHIEERFEKLATMAKKSYPQRLAEGGNTNNVDYFSNVSFLQKEKIFLNKLSKESTYPIFPDFHAFKKIISNNNPKIYKKDDFYHLDKALISTEDLQNILAYLEGVQFGSNIAPMAQKDFTITYFSLEPVELPIKANGIYTCEIKYKYKR